MNYKGFICVRSYAIVEFHCVERNNFVFGLLYTTIIDVSALV